VTRRPTRSRLPPPALNRCRSDGSLRTTRRQRCGR
jgi:hypothetical protein